ncbi:MAG TPA: hypothetical protein ENN87_06825 [Phycisphaerales bacterium]|nr:hypothetical protein [Phycisphaerales bacterium]
MTQTQESSSDQAVSSGAAPPPGRRRIIAFNCKGCHRRYHVPVALCGRTVRCKRCDTYRVIPMVSDAPLSEAEQPAEV